MSLITASVILLLSALATLGLINNFSRRIPQAANKLYGTELTQLQAANHRAKSLRVMASKMRATLSFEVVVEEALDVCSLALEEMGIPRKSLVGAVFLYKGLRLYPVATRRFLGNDTQQGVPGQSGIIGAALTQAEITQTNNPRKDPELTRYMAFHNTVTAVCIPLRAGFNIFGAMVIGSDTEVSFDEDHFDLFTAVADQAVIALQNAQLYQELDAEKQRLIEADEAARKELARDLHDGPTQTIAAIAMRINFIRSLINRDPDQAMQELQKVEDMAKSTSKEIRGMLFTLRPLVLETQGLTAAIETVMKRLHENDGLDVRLVGGENGSLLDENAQSVVFSIVEEALGNARKYSKANLVEVRFWQEDDLFVAQVRDDGVGFDTADVNRDYSSRGSLGMVNMRERAERIDGSLLLESAPGRGTSVMLVVPLGKHGRK
ncbi:MAG: GAF domain-containing sensor histidine kinase [Anaerolineae bacterium]